MFLLEQMLPAVILAMTVGAGVSALAFLWAKERVPSVLAASALGLGYSSGQLLITGWVPFPPVDTTNWLPYFALAAAGLTALLSSRVPAFASSLLFGLLCAAALRLLLAPKFRYGWSAPQGWAWVICFALSIVVIALLLSVVGQRASGVFELAVILIIVCAGTAGALMLSGSILLGQFAAVLGAAVASTLVLALRGASIPAIRPGFALLLSALLLSACFFAELPIASAALLLCAPVFALIPMPISAPTWTFVIRIALVSVPVSVALLLALRASPPLDY